MNIIELHILQSFPPTCLNRDRFGAPKSAMFGGVERARVSSQCWKRPTRELTHEMMPNIFGASRSKILGPAIDKAAKELGANEILSSRVKEIVLSALGKDGNHDGWVNTLFFFSPESLKNVIRPLIKTGLAVEDVSISNEMKTLLFDVMGTDESKWGLVEKLNLFVPEMLQEVLTAFDKDALLSSIVVKRNSEDKKEKEDAEKKYKGLMSDLSKQLEKVTKSEAFKTSTKKSDCKPTKSSIIERFGENVTDAADIALFGRMVADDPSQTVEGAAMFSHALSTHAVRSELDFFSAVDDEKKFSDDSDDAGAGHMGDVEYNSACYYRYIGINLDLLDPAKNKNNCNLFDPDQRRVILETFIKAAVLAIPQARKNSMAGPMLPSYILAVKRSGQPLSLANAFEKPIEAKRGSGYVEPSIAALKKEWADLKVAFGIGGGVECEIEKGKEGTESLAGVLEKLLADI